MKSKVITDCDRSLYATAPIAPTRKLKDQNDVQLLHAQANGLRARSGGEGEVGALGVGTYWFVRSVDEMTVRPRPASPDQPTNVETDRPPEGVVPHC